LNLQDDYDSDEDDLISDFYDPVLRTAITYKRAVAYFSSSSFPLVAKGLGKFIVNGGNLEIIIGKIVSRKDMMLLRGKTEISETISERILSDWKSLTELIETKHIEALAWLFKSNRLKIKFAILFNDKENLPGIFHSKLGILEDNNGNTISFGGSINETESAWVSNIEYFKVYKDWIDGHKNFVQSDLVRWEKYWRNKAKRFQVVNVNNAITNYLHSIAPNNFTIKDAEQLDRSYKEIGIGATKLFSGTNLVPRPYQNEAIKSWIMNNYAGILAMATGTGKTYTALFAMKEIEEIEDKLLLIIAVPYIHLIPQWKESISEMGYRNVVDTDISNWKNKIAMEFQQFLFSKKQRTMVIVTTHATLRGNNFNSFIKRAEDNSISLGLIGDEVHAMGSPSNQKGLYPQFTYRIGLTATPNRWFDTEGTEILLEYFKGITYELPIEEAIPEFLCPYSYHPKLVHLTEEEQEVYDEFTKKIAGIMGKDEKSQTDQNILESYFRKRAQIIINSSMKLDEFLKLLPQYKNDRHVLIYVSPDQIDTVIRHLNRLNFIATRITYEEDLDERKIILDKFGDGKFKILVAIRCLDEGVDIPQTSEAIFLASTTNPRQFIQRRGRILRKFRGKKSAKIVDFIVMTTGKEIFRRELDRMIEFGKVSSNWSEIRHLLDDIVESDLLEEYKVKGLI